MCQLGLGGRSRQRARAQSTAFLTRRMSFLEPLVLTALLVVSAKCVTYEEAKIALQKEMEIWEKCAEENDITEKVLYDVLMQYVLPSSRNIKCMTACHLKGLDIMNDEGFISWDKLDEVSRSEFHMEEDFNKALAVSKACRSNVPQRIGGDLCETGYVATKCFLDEALRHDMPLMTVDLE